MTVVTNKYEFIDEYFFSEIICANNHISEPSGIQLASTATLHKLRGTQIKVQKRQICNKKIYLYKLYSLREHVQTVRNNEEPAAVSLHTLGKI